LILSIIKETEHYYHGNSVYYYISKNESLAAQIITGVFTIAIAVLVALRQPLPTGKYEMLSCVVGDGLEGVTEGHPEQSEEFSC